MTEEQLTVRTKDGDCPLFIYTPTSGHGGPAVIFYFDAGGIRPAVADMAQKLADAGYVVLLPDLFYRHGPYGPFDPVEVLAGDMMAILGPLLMTTNNAKAAEDTGAILDYLSRRSDIRGDKVGTVGFCFGGGMAITAAGTYPDQIGAAASFHGSSLASDAPDSPHLYTSKLKAELYIAAATNDEHYPAEMAKNFEAALEQAGVTYTAETYPAAHGWMKPDFPVYDATSAERGWKEMIGFFDRTLKPAG
ncbi:dienelactone hydrolase family protein [uncultured Roseobacter sp.]|uniref:dienelactone hydrolase family protein n=1 Tax=uncultured Roseobacter sp. TaxID=114847 RepID=UPI002605A166|nr:dienelactone hydrolase family protein [uncultured Roseobacter sp.]